MAKQSIIRHTLSENIVGPPASPAVAGKRWPHARFSVGDYQSQYITDSALQLKSRTKNAEFCDIVYAGIGNATWYKNNAVSVAGEPMVTPIYELLWFTDGIDLGSGPSGRTLAYETWLANNGYDVESAYCHKASNPTERPYIPFDPYPPGNALNLTHPGIVPYFASKITQWTQAGYNTVFWDVFGNSVLNTNNWLADCLEFTRQEYNNAALALLHALRPYTGEGWFVINTAEYTTSDDALMADAAGCAFMEYMMNPYSSKYPDYAWTFAEARLAAGTRVVFGSRTNTNPNEVDNAYSNSVNHAETMYAGYRNWEGNGTDFMVRTRTSEYCLYLMIVDTTSTLAYCGFGTTGGLTYTAANIHMSYNWLKWCEFDIGKPVGARWRVQSGTDPLGQKYEVWAREFENGLAVIRVIKGVLPGTSQTISLGHNTLVTFNLPATATWKQLWPDGSVSPQAQTTIGLRQSEGAIFVRA